MSKQIELISTSIVPHLFSKLGKQKKDKARQFYKSFKQIGIVGTFSGVTLHDGLEFTKDIIIGKLKANAYKRLFVLAPGPIIQIVSIPLYVISGKSKLKRISLLMMDLGSKIVKGEAYLLDMTWFIADLVLFGEPVPSFENCSFKIIGNETSETFFDYIKEGGELGE